MTKGKDEKAPAPGKAPMPGERPHRDGRRRGVLRLRIAVIALAAIGIGLGVLLSGDDDEGAEEPQWPRIVSVEELAAISASSVTPVYWAGEQPGTQLELSEEEESGNFTLRYIAAGAELGSEPATLTIGTYPLPGAEGAIDTVAARPGAIVRRAEDGRKVVSNEENPSSVYFAAGNAAQVEVYDPSPQRAMELALSGEVEPAG